MSNSIEIKAIALKTLLTKENHKVLFEQGEILTVKYDTDGTVHIYSPNGYSSSYSDLKDQYNWSYEEIKDYFITLADWRQQQIDKILDDGS